MLTAALSAGLSHDQFWDLTTHEVVLSVRAHQTNYENQKRLLAWTQSNLMRCWIGNKAPSVNRLMGKPSLKGMSNAEIKEHYRRRQREAGAV